VLFNSFHYAVFFPTVVVLYYCCPQARRWALLLVASCYFYLAYIPLYLPILFGLIAMDYIGALWIESAPAHKRRFYFVAGMAANLVYLGFFKYSNLLSMLLSGVVHPHQGPPPPLGLTFHTFQSMAYLIEVYCGRFKAERHFGYCATYVLFFPQLVAGPIERPQQLLPQLRETHSFQYDRTVTGLRLILLGLFKKVVLADNLGTYVDAVYAKPQSYLGPDLTLAALCFTLQVYFDFAGYIDIARGSSRVLGIELAESFKFPYFAKSIPEFWRRWNITLSAWFRDYVYVPLTYRRQATPMRHVGAVFVVFVLSGLWHGARWTFLIYGLLHGAYIAGSFLWRSITSRFPFQQFKMWDWLQVAGTFALCNFAFVFVRANTVEDAWYIVRHLSVGWRAPLSPGVPRGFNIYLALTVAMVALEGLGAGTRPKLRFEEWPKPLRWSCYYLALFMIAAYGRYALAFFYEQF